MTIGRGEAWGELVARPPLVREARDDAELADLLAAGAEPPVHVVGGDVARTVGARPPGARDEVLALPLDLVDVRLDGGEPHLVAAHVIARPPRWRGGELRGPLLAVMNAEFVGERDVAPRGHPNDGRVEALLVDPSMGLRQRLELGRRLRAATHLPHPAVTVRSVRRAAWDFDRPMVVVADGRRLGRCRRLEVEVRPDAAVVHA